MDNNIGSHPVEGSSDPFKVSISESMFDDEDLGNFEIDDIFASQLEHLSESKNPENENSQKENLLDKSFSMEKIEYFSKEEEESDTKEVVEITQKEVFDISDLDSKEKSTDDINKLYKMSMASQEDDSFTFELTEIDPEVTPEEIKELADKGDIVGYNTESNKYLFEKTKLQSLEDLSDSSNIRFILPNGEIKEFKEMNLGFTTIEKIHIFALKFFFDREQKIIPTETLSSRKILVAQKEISESRLKLSSASNPSSDQKVKERREKKQLKDAFNREKIDQNKHIENERIEESRKKEYEQQEEVKKKDYQNHQKKEEDLKFENRKRDEKID